MENLAINPDEFKNKTIFIGASAIGLHDLKPTSIGNNIPGVFMHASILSNILQKSFLSPAAPLTTLIYIFLTAIMAAMAVLFGRNIIMQLIIPLAWVITYFSIANWSYDHNQAFEIIAPLTSLIFTWTAAYLYLFFTEEKEKKKIRQMFSQYVSPAALSAMVDQYGDYTSAGSGTKESVSILFSDIRGFTSLSEHHNAETVVEILNHYLGHMTKVIHKHNGTVDKFIGDAIMAIWGAPIKSNTYALDSVNAAIEMIDRLREVNDWLNSKDLPDIKIGIGVNTGEVILGSIGSEQKADYTVIGDNVNLASRLEGATKFFGCSILISESTYLLIENKIPCLLVDMLRVKGKQKPIKIYTPAINELGPGEHPQSQAINAAKQSQLAFEHYLNREWEDAIQLYQQLPDSKLREFYLQRCEEYQESPPDADWDGAYTMTSK